MASKEISVKSDILAGLLSAHALDVLYYTLL